MFNPKKFSFWSRARRAVTWNYDPGSDTLEDVSSSGYFPARFVILDDADKPIGEVHLEPGHTIIYDVVGTEGDCTLTVTRVEPKVEVLKLGEPTARLRLHHTAVGVPNP